MDPEPLRPPKRLLMGPGPSNVDEAVLAAQALPLIGHLDPAFLELMDRISAMLRAVFQTDNALTLPLSGTGSAGMEAALVNVLRPGGRAVIGVNGVFGTRLAEVAYKCGSQAELVERPWGEVFSPDDFRPALSRGDADALVVVHAETSTGACQPMEGLGTLAREHGALLIVDTVTSLGGIPVTVDAWGADVVYSGTQKCLSCPPGLAPITLSERGVEAMSRRAAGTPPGGPARPATSPNAIPSWYLDLARIGRYWGRERVYHHTAPVSALYGLHEALRLVLEEGLARRFERHRACSAALWAGLKVLDLAPWGGERDRLPMLNAVTVPEGVDEAKVRSVLLNEHGIEIGGGLGALQGRIWRVGLMGHSCRMEHVTRFLEAFTAALGAQRRVPPASDVLAAAGRAAT